MPDHMHAVEKRPSKYIKDESRRELLRMLREGTPALRQDPRKWIPPRSQEQQRRPSDRNRSDYEERIDRTVVDPFFDSAVNRACGTVLSQPIALGGDVPEILQQHWQDVDLKGNKGDIFIRRVLDDALGDGGMSHVLTDRQPAADDPNQGRPYWVHVRARDLLPPRFDVINGELQLLEVRIIEGSRRTDLEDPYGDPVDVERIRILRAPMARDTERNREQARLIRENAQDPMERLENLLPISPWVTWELWEIRDIDNKEEKERLLIGSGTMEPHVTIPLKTLYVGKKGEYDAVTPFEHLAHLNMLHTRRQSDFEDSMMVSMGAVLHRVCSEEEAKNQNVIGDRVLLSSNMPEARAEWIERGGSAARVSMDAQEALENRMRALGNEPLIRRVGPETATGRQIDETEAQTEAQAWAIATEDFTVNCLDDMAIFEGLDSGGTVSVPTPDAMNEIDLPVLEFWRDTSERNSWPSPVTVMRMAQESSLMPDWVEPEKEMLRRDEEMP